MPKSISKRVVCIGGANIDRKIKLSDKVKLYTSNPAETTISSGGVARNISENLARLECPVSIVTLFGKDPDGEKLCTEFRECGIDYQLSQSLSAQRTGCYISISDPQGEMIIGTADMGIYDHISLNWLEGIWSQIVKSEWIFLDTNFSAEAIKWLIQKAQEDQIMLCIDPVSSAKATKLPQKLNGIELIVLNVLEAEIITGIPWQEQQSCHAIKDKLLSMGAKKMILTMGKEGIYAATEYHSNFFSAPSVSVKDVTGAGDSLAAGVIFGLIQDLSLFEACEIGLRNVALNLQTEETVFSGLTPKMLF